MKRGLAMSALALALAATGCVKFPYGSSIDKHNFVSTPSRPLTISVEDALTRDELLRIDVPVGKKLVIDFGHKTDWSGGPSSAMSAETVRWQVLPPGKTFKGQLRNEMALSGNPVRMKVTIREPQSMIDADAPDYQPTGAGPRPEGAGPRYQPSDDEQGDGASTSEGRPTPREPGANGEQIAPERGPATREPLEDDRMSPEKPDGEGGDEDGPAEGDGSAGPAPSDLEGALEGGGEGDGPTYVPEPADGDAGDGPAGGAEDDGEAGDQGDGARDTGVSPLGAGG